MTDDAMLAAIQEIVQPYGLKAEIWPDVKRVCVRGDARAYFPVVNFFGISPGLDLEVLAELSTIITNRFNIGSVVLQLVKVTHLGPYKHPKI